MRRRVAVIGGGIAGASAAWALSTANDVVLIEQESLPGHHATGRSAAILSETSGHPVVCALAGASRSFLERPPDGFVDHPLTTPRGLLWIVQAVDAAFLEALKPADGASFSSSAYEVAPDAAVDMFPVLRPAAVEGGAVFEPDALSIDVAALLQGFLREAKRRGTQVLVGAPMTAARFVRRTRGQWHIDVDGTVIVADVVVNCAGAWGDVVAQRADVQPLGLRALRRTACVVPAPGVDPTWHLVMDAAGRHYFGPEGEGLLASPADETPSEPTDARAMEEDVARALDAVRESTTIPVRSIRRAWAGLRTFTPDRVPVLGEDSHAPGFFWLVGQGGAGIKTAPALAAALASVVDEQPWPATLSALGVSSADLAPQRLTLGTTGSG